jgi:hypothetical protein
MNDQISHILRLTSTELWAKLQKDLGDKKFKKLFFKAQILMDKVDYSFLID